MMLYNKSCSVAKHVQLLALCNPLDYSTPAPLSFTVSKNWLKFMSPESATQPNHLILCHPLLFMPSIFPSISVFSSELPLHIRWTKY